MGPDAITDKSRLIVSASDNRKPTLRARRRANRKRTRDVLVLITSFCLHYSQDLRLIILWLLELSPIEIGNDHLVAIE